ncbi:MAG: ribonuclease P protein component [Candidatus Xenobia bacterium]
MRKNREYQLVFGRGRNQVGRTMVVHSWRTRYAESRLGISVSKKVGGAVVRNRVRRVLMEICRHLWPRVRSHHDVVLVARKGLELSSFEETRSVLLELLQRARLLQEPKHEAASPVGHPPVSEVLKTDTPGLPL